MKTSNAQFKSKRLRQAAARLVNCVFDYHRVAYDHRRMTFQANGMIGQGAGEREVFWKLKETDHGLVLEISSENEVTCRLKAGADRVWRGRWIHCERMPVELSPISGRGITRRSSGPCASNESLPESLFVVSLPRSLSTLVYHCARQAMGLQEPAWTSAGEVLNMDRYALFQGSTHDSNRKYLSPNAEPGLFYAATQFLNQLVVPFGQAYKDVVQPFVTAQWLAGRGLRVLRIRRNLADVAYAMLGRRWFYPSRLFPKEKDVQVALVRGLILAEQALDSIPAICLDFDQVILDEEALHEALRTLYPKRKIRPFKFIDDNFKEMRQQILKRRRTRKHKILTDYWVNNS